MEASRQFWGVPRFDLMQVHNLLAWQQHLPKLFEMKAAGRLRYVGITTSEGRRHAEIEQVMRSQPIDFVQISYNLLDREVEQRILPLAVERGIGVIVNRPFREGALLQQLAASPSARLGGARSTAHIWAQVALKFVDHASGRHLRDSGHQPGGASAAEHGGGARAACPTPRCASAWRARLLRCEQRQPPPGGGNRPHAGARVSEWWSYRPSDFLMFSPRIYWRLFESLNAAVWPAQVVLVGVALAWVGGFVRGARGRGDAGLRIAAAALALALCWLFVAWAFLWQRYAPINWAASGFAAAFVLQALGLLALAGMGGVQATVVRSRHGAGIALLLWALLGHPLLAWAAGRPWQQAEVFGLTPDATALGTLGWLLLLEDTRAASRRLMRCLWVLPLLWCMLSAATLWTMGSVQAAVLLAGVVLALAAVLRR